MRNDSGYPCNPAAQPIPKYISELTMPFMYIYDDDDDDDELIKIVTQQRASRATAK